MRGRTRLKPSGCIFIPEDAAPLDPPFLSQHVLLISVLSHSIVDSSSPKCDGVSLSGMQGCFVIIIIIIIARL